MRKNLCGIEGRLLKGLLLSMIFYSVIGAWAPARVEEISDHYPYPPGKNAKLVKEVCTPCHYAELVTMRDYDEESARRYYELWVGDPDSEQGKKVIEYLITVLGQKSK